MNSVVSLTSGATWLVQFLEPRLATLDLQGCCLTAFGLACVLKTLAGEAPLSLGTPFAELGERLGDLSAKGDAASAFDEGASLICLMAAAAHVGLEADYDSFRHYCVQHWIQQADAYAAQLPHGRAANVLLAVLQGEVPVPTPPDGLLALQVERSSPYCLETDAILALTTDLHVWAAYGYARPTLPPSEAAFLAEALPFWTFYFIKQRDLDMVGPLTRSLYYLGWTDCPEYNDGIRFISKQQQPDGRFGRHNLETQRLALTLGSDFDMDRHLYLALTVSSLWTLSLQHPRGAPLFGA